jgi:hypothetical protein
LHANTLPDISGSFAGFQCAAYDKVGGKVWSAIGENDLKGYCGISATSPYTFESYTQNIPASSAHFGSQWAVVVPDLRLLVVSSYSSTNVYVLDLTNPSAGFVEKATTNGIVNLADWGAVYHHPSSSILIHEAEAITDGSIRKLKVPRNGDGSYNSSGSWDWTVVSKASGSPSPVFETTSGNFSGTYSKFNMVEDMGNGQSCIVMTLGIGAGYTWVYKLPVGEVT